MAAPCGDATWAYLRRRWPHGGTSWPWASTWCTFVRLENQATAPYCMRCIRCNAERSSDHRSAAFYNPVGHMNLKRRLAKLETAALHQAGTEPVFSEEDRAIMQRIVNRWYADPERYAARIAIFEQVRERLEANA